MEIDHVIAVGLFIVVFGSSLALVSNHVMDVKETTGTVLLKEKALLLMESLSKNETLISPAYKLYLYAKNQNSSTADGSISIDFNKFGSNDPNSAYIVDDSGKEYGFLKSGNTIMFSATLTGNAEKWFTVYYDDNSNFSDRSSSVSGTEKFLEKIYGPEQIFVVQYKGVQEFLARDYNSSKTMYGTDFNVKVLDKNGATRMTYGQEQPKKMSVALSRKNVLVQTSDAKIVEGVLEIRVW